MLQVAKDGKLYIKVGNSLMRELTSRTTLINMVVSHAFELYDPPALMILEQLRTTNFIVFCTKAHRKPRSLPTPASILADGNKTWSVNKLGQATSNMLFEDRLPVSSSA
jgi:hypothetical protein